MGGSGQLLDSFLELLARSLHHPNQPTWSVLGHPDHDGATAAVGERHYWFLQPGRLGQRLLELQLAALIPGRSESEVGSGDFFDHRAYFKEGTDDVDSN